MKRQGHITQRQREQLVALGAMLRDTREASERSLEDVAQQTLMRPKLILALESAQMEELPEPIYIQGLIRRYGDALGLDGQGLAEQYFVGGAAADQPSRRSAGVSRQLRPFHLYGAYVALIAVSVGGLSFLMQQALPEDVAEPILDPEAVEQLRPQRSAQQLAQPGPEAAPQPSQPEEPIVVKVQLVQQSWMRVTIDGDQEFEGILQEGTERSWQAEESLTIRAGNAGGVVLAYNQEPSRPMGQPGAVAEETFTPTAEMVSLSP